MSEDIKPEVIKRTQDTLGKYFKKPQLMEKFLRKPPFRFLHDIVTAVIRETGFLKGLFSPEEMNCDNLKDRESKVAFLQKLIDAVKAISGEPLAARPTKIVAGQEPTRTNELLQAIGKALANKLSSVEVVEQMKSGKVGKPASNRSKTTAGKVAAQSQSKDRTRNRDADKSDKKKTVPGKVIDSQSKSTQRKEDKKEPKGSKEKKVKSVGKGNVDVEQSEVIKIEEAVKMPPEIMNPPVSAVIMDEKNSEMLVEKEIVEAAVAASNKEEHGEKSSKQVSKEDAEPKDTSCPTENDATNIVDQDVGVDGPINVPDEPVQLVQRPPSALGVRKTSAKVMTGVRGSADAMKKELEGAGLKQQSEVELLGRQSNEVLKEQAKPLRADESRTKTPPSLQRPVSMVRPASARRSARPASARPAAPRIRDHGEVAIVEETPAVPGKVNVIQEGNASAEPEEDETFVVLETQAPTFGEELPRSPAPEPQERGHLVAQILETQKELEDRGHAGSAVREAGQEEVEWEVGQRREREAAGREVERLSSSIQTLTRAAYPLGKLVDFLHEDVDAMQRELMRWRSTKNELVRELRQEQALTERSLQPLKLRLHNLQDAIDEERDHIATVKATMLHHDERISKLLTGGASLS